MKQVGVQEADRPAEKVLDLPTRSRFGEGTAQPPTFCLKHLVLNTGLPFVDGERVS
jgi:hypothetical protein